MLITPSIEPCFHEDSYAYRPHRSAHDAVGKARERCWKYAWVLDMDISKFFDTIDHELLLKALKRHTQEKWVLMYIERWLKVPYEKADGSQVDRALGVPQGSVIGLRICFFIIPLTSGWKRAFPVFHLRDMLMIQFVTAIVLNRLSICKR